MYENNPIREVVALLTMFTVFAVFMTLAFLSAAITQIIAWLPLLILATGLSAAAIIYAWRSGRNRERPAQTIERQVVYILPADSPRRELWQAIADGRADPLLLTDGEKVKVRK